MPKVVAETSFSCDGALSLKYSDRSRLLPAASLPNRGIYPSAVARRPCGKLT